MAHNVTTKETSVSYNAWNQSTASNSLAKLSGGTILNSYDFSDSQAPSDGNYSAGVNAPSTTDYSNGYVRGTIPLSADNTGNVPYDRYTPPIDTQEIYVEFDARFPTGNVSGLKFFKVHGRTDGTGSSNTTAGPNYALSHHFDRISYGDGTAINNDTAHQIRFDGTTSASDIGRSSGTAQISTPQNKMFSASDWGTDWHHFRYYIRFNTGTTAENEVADGAFYVEIDGDVYCDAGGLFNRNYQNSQFINSVAIFGWAQTMANEIILDYDNFVFSQNGFV